MSVIPFVTIFITIIALTWSSLSFNLTTTQLCTKGFISHMSALNKAYSKIEEMHYATAAKEKNEDSPTKHDRADKIYKSSRINSKIESSKLFLSKNSDKEVKSAFKSLIDHLYSEAPYYHKMLAEQISEVIFPLLGEDIELHTIVFKNDDLDEAWYQMLKGGAFPSLTEYITVAKLGQTTPLYAQFASIPVLIAFIGSDATIDLLKCEEEQYYAQTEKKSHLHEDEFSTLLSKHNISQLKKYFNFSAAPKVHQVIEGHEGDISVLIQLYTQ